MSELIQKNDNRATIKWKLLTGVSALALTVSVSSAGTANAEDTAQPQIWIELGGQLSRLEDGQKAFSPSFETARPSIFSSSEKYERPPLYSIDEFASLSFRPEESSWIFGASIRYGRSLARRHVHQQTNPEQITFHKYPTLPSHSLVLTHKPLAARFADTNARNSEQHTILDFQAGKDVGLGLFGSNSSSTLSLGIRFAQFRSTSNIALRSDPDWHFQPKYFQFGPEKIEFMVQPYHSNAASISAERNFHGVGPSLSWNSSLPFAGNSQDGELVLDWGVNAAALFGRQKIQTQHYTSVQYHPPGNGFGVNPGLQPGYHHPTNTPAYHNTRSRNVTVPNVGGSVGLSWRLQNFKMSLGYKADFFFNAIDGGIDARKEENRSFYGPYASISIGLGD